ncbi:MAG: Gfo/Idh/MocA family protein [Candidatus Sumerlaeia bacterium]
MAKILKCAVIGMGMGRNHVREFNLHPNASVVAIADLDEERLKEIGDLNNVPRRYTSPEKMLKEEELDIVSIATPNKFHKPLTIKALDAGCNVLCEKPMAMNAREAQAMLDKAKAVGKRLMINFSYRFTEQAWALKQQVEKGILGDIYFGRTIWLRRRGMPRFGGWFGQKALSGGGPLIDLGVHRLDLALWLMGYPKPIWVMGRAWSPIASEKARQEGKEYDVEDMAAGMIQFENGAMLEVEASWASNIAERELMETRLLGTKGGLVQRNLDETYKFEAEIYLEKDGCPFDMKLHPPVPAAKPSAYHLVDCIVKDVPNIATAEEGVTVMKLLDAIYASAKKNAPIKIKQ